MDRRRSDVVLDIAFINNMPDTALLSTERQFRDCVNSAGGGIAVRLHVFTLPAIQRGAENARHIAEHYGDFASLRRTIFDVAIVTGNEPKAARLDDEPYWAEMAALIDWARDNTRVAIWSCLAAHCAVLHLDGIKRQPLQTKLSGIYACDAMKLDPLLIGTEASVPVPHSRWNALDAEELSSAGYEILRQSKDAGIDLFARDCGSRFVFMQGHPEYATDSLLREFRRDVGRYLRSERPNYPAEPVDYFSREASVMLQAYRRRCETHRDPALFDVFPSVASPFAIDNRWQRPTQLLYRNIFQQLAARKGRTAAVA